MAVGKIWVGRTPVLLEDRGVSWQSGLQVDADGSPLAYHPRGLGLDHLANAGHQGNWWGLVTDAEGNPVVQGPDDPAPGYYVSSTSLVDRSRRREDPRRYVDSMTVPYLAMPPEVLREGGLRVGDLAWVARGDLDWPAVVADVGPHGKIGEGSVALALALGVDADPKRGGCDSGVRFAVFPRSGGTWPLEPDSLRAFARAALEAWGGLKKLRGA